MCALVTGVRTVALPIWALQDWFLRYERKTMPDVAEVANVGGMVQAWQIITNPQALAARGITVEQVIEAIRAANGATGGSVIEQAGADVMVRSTGYLQTREDFENVPVTTGGVPVLLGEVARVRSGPTLRRGIAEQIGRAHVCTQVTNGHVVCRRLLVKKKNIRK